MIGSEGILGVITEAWMRLQDRPTFRASATGRFSDFHQGAQAARAIVQAGLWPSNCRLLDPTEALLMGTDDGSASLLLIAFESADHPLDARLARAVELVRDLGGEVRDDEMRISAPTAGDATGSTAGERTGSAGEWRNAFVRAPYTRDSLVALGMVNDTFETSITWDRFPKLYDDCFAAVRAGAAEAGCGDPVITCRFTHVYVDGPAPYFTVIAPGDRTRLVEQWDTIKRHVFDALAANGATVTHHHAVGRDHRPGYDRQRPDLFADALRAAKAAVDPNAVLNPGVLIDP